MINTITAIYLLGCVLSLGVLHGTELKGSKSFVSGFFAFIFSWYAIGVAFGSLWVDVDKKLNPQDYKED